MLFETLYATPTSGGLGQYQRTLVDGLQATLEFVTTDVDVRDVLDSDLAEAFAECRTGE